MSRAFYIHAGAHRTGTSSFQSCLDLNHDLLSREGFDLAYPGRDGINGGSLGLRLPSPRHGTRLQERFAKNVRKVVNAFSRGESRPFILSEENIPGRMLPFFSGQFYPSAEARVGALKQGLAGQVAGLLFVVRDYPNLFRSAWRKRAEDKGQTDFAKSIDKLVAIDRGWPELLSLMISEMQPERCVVVEYAARGRSVDLLERLIPNVPGLQEPERQLNSSVTEAGLEVVQAHLLRGETLSDAERLAIFQEHAHDRVPRNLTRFPPEAEKVLLNKYARDLERIDAMPGVDFVSAP